MLRSFSPKSETAEAIRYALSRWRALTRYVDDGRIEIDNSAAPSGRSAPLLWAERIIFSVVPMVVVRAQPPSIHCSERRSSTELIPNCGCAKC